MNPFINPALTTQRPQTVPTLSSTFSSPISTTEQSLPTVAEVTTTRKPLPRKDSNGEDRRVNIGVRKSSQEKKNDKGGRAIDKPEKKKSKSKKKQSRSEELGITPPVKTGCFSLCDSLIFEVYQLMGGAVCDC